jgi:ferrous iron transport protein A
MTLGEIAIGRAVTVSHVGGERAFRRRMMELGLLPGTVVRVLRIAPLGDPMEILVRGCLLSIRKDEARCIGLGSEHPDRNAAPVPERTAPRASGIPASP